MTALDPPAGRVFSVLVSLPGDPADEAIERLAKNLGTKASETLRRGVSAVRVEAAHENGSAVITATVNDWHAGAAAIRITTLLILKAGDGWDTARMSVSAGPIPPS